MIKLKELVSILTTGPFSGTVFSGTDGELKDNHIAKVINLINQGTIELYKRFKFLENEHRHMFKVEVKISVTHDDRELEFFLVKWALTEFLKESKMNKIMKHYAVNNDTVEDVKKLNKEELDDVIKDIKYRMTKGISELNELNKTSGWLMDVFSAHSRSQDILKWTKYLGQAEGEYKAIKKIISEINKPKFVPPPVKVDVKKVKKDNNVEKKERIALNNLPYKPETVNCYSFKVFLLSREDVNNEMIYLFTKSIMENIHQIMEGMQRPDVNENEMFLNSLNDILPVHPALYNPKKYPTE